MRLHVVPEVSELNGVFHVARLLACEDGGELVCATDGGLAERIAAADEVWVHGLWLPRLWRACRLALKTGKGLVRMTHGSLSPVYLARQGKWKKRLVGPVERRLLRRSRALVATCSAEADWIRAYLGTDCPPVETQDLLRFFAFPAVPSRPAPDAGRPLHVLCLGRRHPLKGVGELERAVTELNAERRDAVELRIVSEAVGEEKERAWAWCDVLCLPSLSENFGLVVAEALAHGKRVVVSDGAPAWRGCLCTHPERGVFLDGYVRATPEERVRTLKSALKEENQK